jgi:hypothetical protein
MLDGLRQLRAAGEITELSLGICPRQEFIMGLLQVGE